MRLLIDLGSSRIMEGGWLDELLIYRGSSFSVGIVCAVGQVKR